MNNDLKIIKKKYGEKMSHLCAELFPTLLEKEGLLSNLLLMNFHESRYLYQDIIDNNLINNFKNFIYSFVDVENNNNVDINKDPVMLMDSAGYILQECYTEDDIQSYRKYYASGEVLCSFSENRLNRCRVFFAVKKNVDEIKRENFQNPTRQDEYGTSVISIQFTKDGTNTLSIKNRYNHRVNNPDATFSNNLDNIIPGLTNSFALFYGLRQAHENNNFEIPGYVRANDGKHYKFYKYNFEKNNVYYCLDNIIIDDFLVQKYDKSRYLIIDYFILDLVNKKIELYDKTLYDSFQKSINNIVKISIKNIDDGKKISIMNYYNELLEIYIDKFGRITRLDSDDILNIDNNFLYLNTTLDEFNFSRLEYIRNNFLANNRVLTKLYVPNLLTIENDFLIKNNSLRVFEAPKLEKVGNNFLINSQISKLNLPSLLEIGNDFLYYNELLSTIEVPKLHIVGNNFLYLNNELTELNFESLKQIGNSFLFRNESLKKINAPSLVSIGNNFLYYNEILNEINFLNLKNVGNNFLYSNNLLTGFEAPKLVTVGDSFLRLNVILNKLFIPKLITIGNDALFFNLKLSELNAPNLKTMGEDCLYHNTDLIKLNIPKLLYVERGFLHDNVKFHDNFNKRRLTGIYTDNKDSSFVQDDEERFVNRRR